MLNLIRDVQTKQTSWNAQAKLSAQVFKNLRLTASFVNGLTVVRGPGLRFNAGEVPAGPLMPLSWNASQTTNYSTNISNAFNAQTATNVYTQRYRYNITPGDAALVDKNWEPAANATLHPWFMKDWTFLAPLQARLGIKFVF